MRDFFLKRDLLDVDLTVNGHLRSFAKRLGDHLNAPFFMLNENYDTARIIWEYEVGHKLNIDLVGMNGKNIEEDLLQRDFSINAMAFDITDLNTLIDPCKGLLDLKEKTIRACAPASLKNDPIRVLRAIRQAVLFGFKIDIETIGQIKSAKSGLAEVSNERVRDELFKVFSLTGPATAILIFERLGIFEFILPEIERLINYVSPDRASDSVWEHTTKIIKFFPVLFGVLLGDYPVEGAADLQSGKAVKQLGRYRKELTAYFASTLSGDRKLITLLYFAALYHDAGKMLVKQDGEHITYREHDLFGSQLIDEAARRLALSNQEVNWLVKLVKNHMLLHFAIKNDADLDKRWIYRYIQLMGDAGVGLVFLSLADTLAPQTAIDFNERYDKELFISRQILEAYFGEDESLRNPQQWLDGNEIMSIRSMQPGPALGKIVTSLREETAIGNINTLEAAKAFVKEFQV